MDDVPLRMLCDDDSAGCLGYIFVSGKHSEVVPLWMHLDVVTASNTDMLKASDLEACGAEPCSGYIRRPDIHDQREGIEYRMRVLHIASGLCDHLDHP